MSSEARSNFTLGDGLLNDDLDYLDNARYYPQNITLNSIDQLLHSINYEDEDITIPSNSNQIHIFCIRLAQSSRRGIHIVMKWLIYFHSVLKQTQSQRVLQIFYEGLSKLNLDHSFTCSSDYDKYMKKTLVKPYLQYLMKLTLLIMKQILENRTRNQQFYTPRSPTKNFATEKILKSKGKNSKFTQQSADSDQKSQRSPKRNKSPISRLRRYTQPLIVFAHVQSSNNNWYQKYNLILFILQQFYKPINEFSGYFAQFYQFLNNFAILIKQDIKNFYRTVTKKYRSSVNKQIQLISLIQMEKLHQKVQIFMQLGPKGELQKSLFTELDENFNFIESNHQFQNFLGSSHKIPLLQQLYFETQKQKQKVKNPQAISKENTNDSKDSKQFCCVAKKIEINFS